MKTILCFPADTVFVENRHKHLEDVFFGEGRMKEILAAHGARVLFGSSALQLRAIDDRDVKDIRACLVNFDRPDAEGIVTALTMNGKFRHSKIVATANGNFLNTHSMGVTDSVEINQGKKEVLTRLGVCVRPFCASARGLGEKPIIYAANEIAKILDEALQAVSACPCHPSRARKIEGRFAAPAKG